MINLLPPKNKQEIKAGRSNLLLLRYTILSGCALLFLLGGIGFTHFYLESLGDRADTERDENVEKASGYSQTQVAASSLRAGLEDAKKLLDEDVHYSKVLTRFSSLLPEGTAVTTLALSKDSLTQPTTIIFMVRGEKEAQELTSSLTNTAYLTNVTTGRLSTNPVNPTYPYLLEMNVTFDRSIAL